MVYKIMLDHNHIRNLMWFTILSLFPCSFHIFTNILRNNWAYSIYRYCISSSKILLHRFNEFCCSSGFLVDYKINYKSNINSFSLSSDLIFSYNFLFQWNLLLNMQSWILNFTGCYLQYREYLVDSYTMKLWRF
mgnify:CR=1 FL=1